jgi:hypothetical protein
MGLRRGSINASNLPVKTTLPNLREPGAYRMHKNQNDQKVYNEGEQSLYHSTSSKMASSQAVSHPSKGEFENACVSTVPSLKAGTDLLKEFLYRLSVGQ